MSFKDKALPLAARGIPVIPVQPGEKRCLLPAWQTKATTDTDQILQWDKDNPDYNVGAVGKPDGIAILDCDVKGLKKRIETETGHKFPPTLVVKSAGKGAAHIYMSQNEWSRKLGNQKAPGLFDLQSVDKYVVGPGSTLSNGREYVVVDDSPLCEFPRWLYDWIVKQTVPEKPQTTTAGDGTATEHQLLDFLDYTKVTYEKIKDGIWDVKCPWEYRHTGEGSYGDSVVTLIDGMFGFGCKHNHCAGRDWHDFREAADPDGMCQFQPPEELDTAEVLEILESFNVDHTEPMAVSTGDLISGAAAGMPNSQLVQPKITNSEPAPANHEPTSKPEDKSFVLVRGKRNDAIITLKGIRASDIQEELLEWLWPLRIPLGKITWLAGKPDCGKSVALTDIIARVSSGKDFPDGRKNEWGSRKVLLGCTEDGLGDTVKPRLIAADANLDNVIVLDNDAIGTQTGDTQKQRMLRLKDDIKLLKATLKANPDIILVALDPITGYFGDVDTNKDKDIRPVMDQLIKACDEMRVTFIAVMHLNKRSDVDAIHKILGASSVAGGARTAWGFSRDLEDDELCHMARIKNNLSKDRTGLDYKIASKEVELKGRMVEHPCIEWLGINEATADDLIAKERESRRQGAQDRKLEAARAFLRMKFAQSFQHKCTALYEEAEAEDISNRTLKRARTELHQSGELPIEVDDRRAAGQGYWWWIPPHEKDLLDGVEEAM